MIPHSSQSFSQDRSSHEGQVHDAHFKALIHKAKEGDPDAFGLLYEEYLTPIYRFIMLRVRNKADAEELSQTTFLKAWNGIHSFEDQGKPFLSWLYTVARNTVIDYWKKKKDVHIESDEPYFESLPDHVADPHAQAFSHEQGALLKEALRTLTPDQQEIIVLKFIEERTNKEISDITGKTEDAIRQLQFRALKSLRESFPKDSL